MHARNTQRLLIDDERAVFALRLKNQPRAEDLAAICDFVRQRIGTAYSTREAVKTVLGGHNLWTRKQFCSRLVAQAFASRGIGISDSLPWFSKALKDFNEGIRDGFQKASIVRAGAEYPNEGRWVYVGLKM